jgi:hypothetical protein
LPGIVCRSTAEGAPAGSEELVWFDRYHIKLEVLQVRGFDDWYGELDW